MTDPVETTLYQRLGGEPAVRRLTRRFYELMDTLPEAAACRRVHRNGLQLPEQKLTDYLTGWFGGPQLYIEKYGQPMLRRRHFVAPIGGEEVSGWLICFRRAVAETVPDDLATIFMPKIEALAKHMQNRAGDSDDTETQLN